MFILTMGSVLASEGKMERNCKICSSKETNIFGYCWEDWDRMTKEDSNMIKAGGKKLVTSRSSREVKPTFWNKVKCFFTGETTYNPYNHIPIPYEMEYGKRVPEIYRMMKKKEGYEQR